MRGGEMPQRILLVGSSGNVGRMISYYWRNLLTKDSTIVAQHRDKDRSDGFYWPLLESDDGRLKNQGFSSIVCLAGITPGVSANLDLNTTLAENVLKAAHTSGIRRVLLASSSAVYGSGQQFRENGAKNPLNAYGVAKIDMEEACAPWRESGLEVCCLRIGNVLGADALAKSILRLNKKEPLTIDCFTDGKGPVRSYIGPKTLSEVLFTLATHQSSIPKALNVASPREVYMEDLAKASNHPFIFRTAPENAHQKITLDCERLTSIHSFRANDSDPKEMVMQWKEIINQ